MCDIFVKEVVKGDRTYRFLIMKVDTVEITLGYLDRFNNLIVK